MEGLPAPSTFRALDPEQLRLLQTRPGWGLLGTLGQSLSRSPRVEARRVFPAGMQAKDRRRETADPASPRAPATDAVTSQGRDALFACLPGLNSGPPSPGSTAGSEVSSRLAWGAHSLEVPPRPRDPHLSCFRSGGSTLAPTSAVTPPAPPHAQTSKRERTTADPPRPGLLQEGPSWGAAGTAPTHT
ncbi:unnamed protein product [Rangifer tarandus platyrhynchus]|uniref:Uncharacterized protein n=1 Tax=Rangifer tarandus platyrhynchus TaxID=3082113 RepID=A0AC59Z689_RANTA